MAILGKVLAVLNVLAALAFACLLSLDWAKRHSWAYAVYRDDLMINGLPLDEDERDPREPDVRLADRLSDASALTHFRPIGGDPVRTQLEEVERLHKRLQGELAALNDETEKRNKFKALLLPLARTGAEQDELAARIGGTTLPIVAGTPAPLDELTADLDSLFEAVKKDEGQQAARPVVAQLLPKGRRQAVAHLLFNLNPTDQGQVRTQVVVGLKAFNEEALRQADALAQMDARVRASSLGDRVAFEVDYRGLTNDVRDRAENLQDRQLFLDNQQKLKTEHTQLVESRHTDVKEVKEKMEATRLRINESRTRQAKEEKMLFDAQRVLGNVSAENEKLEREIRALEKKAR